MKKNVQISDFNSLLIEVITEKGSYIISGTKGKDFENTLCWFGSVKDNKGSIGVEPRIRKKDFIKDAISVIEGIENDSCVYDEVNL